MRHFFRFLLAHGAPQQVGFTERVSGEAIGDLHHLLLVHDHAECLLQNLLQFGQFVFHLLAAMLAIDEVVDHAALNGAGPVERVQSSEIFDRVRLVFSQHVAHAVRFKLEHARSQPLVKNFLIRLRIFERNLFQRDRRAAGLHDQLERVGKNRQRGQPEKIHLQQAHLFDGHHVEGGDDFVVLGLVQRDEIGERARRDHHSSCVHSGVAHQPFQLSRRLDQFANLAVSFNGLAQLGRIFNRLLNRDVELRGHHLGDAVDVGIRDVHGAADVFDRGLRGHGAKRDDLRHVVAPVFLRDVVDDFAAAVHAEINIDIGHGHALGIQEALEQQLMLQRIEIGDSKRVGNQRSGRRSAPRTYRNFTLLRVADEVPHDHEVSGKLHLLNDLQLALQPLIVVGERMLEFPQIAQWPQSFKPPRVTLARDVYKVAVECIARRNVKFRKRRGDFFHTQIAAPGNIQRAAHHLRRVFEHAQHLVVTLHEELRALEFHAGGVVDRLAGLDAHHHVLRVRIFFAEVMAVVGRHQRQAKIFFQLEKAGMDAVLHCQSLILNLEKEILPAENVGERAGGRARSFVVPFRQPFGDFALQTS